MPNKCGFIVGGDNSLEFLSCGIDSFSFKKYSCHVDSDENSIGCGGDIFRSKYGKLIIVWLREAGLDDEIGDWDLVDSDRVDFQKFVSGVVKILSSFGLSFSFFSFLDDWREDSVSTYDYGSDVYFLMGMRGIYPWYSCLLNHDKGKVFLVRSYRGPFVFEFEGHIDNRLVC